LDNSLIITTLLGLITILLLAYELYARRKLYREELNLQQKKLEAEQKEREQREQWLKEQTVRLTEVSELLAEKITIELKQDIGWASEALDRAKLRPRVQSVFYDRLGHLREEKEDIAEHFIPILLNRCKHLVDCGNSVYLLIDSGTTLYTFFEKLGQETVRYYDNKGSWLNKLTIVTNNLAGIEKLMETGRISPSKRYSPLAVKCYLLPGEPLPIYAAVTGQTTIDALDILRYPPGHKKKKETKNKFIGLVTGNWIRLQTEGHLCPIPLARGTGHLEFKQKLITYSDEIYIATPLGKIFIDASLTSINKALELESTKRDLDPSKQSYDEVNISEQKIPSVKLISTYRLFTERVLYDHGLMLQGLLGGKSFIFPNQFPETLIKQTLPHILFPFDKLPSNRYLEIETEFPHITTQREEFMRKFFHVRPNPTR
jgi:hypothetical protein